MANPQPSSGDHYFTAAPASASAPRTVTLVLPEGTTFELATDRGTFSPTQVDAGTRALLLEGPAAPATGTVVDLGCGYGPIALALAARSGPGTTVVAIDVNERARELCEANAATAGLADRVQVLAPEAWPEGTAVDELWSNPPIRIGKAALHDLLATWLGRLAPGAAAHLVVQKDLGADSLARWLDAEGWRTTRRATRARYRIIDVEARP